MLNNRKSKPPPLKTITNQPTNQQAKKIDENEH